MFVMIIIIIIIMITLETILYILKYHAGSEASNVFAVQLRLRENVFARNVVARDGGSLSLHEEVSGQVEDCRFEGNVALQSGGAVAVKGGSFRSGAVALFRNCSFVNNTAEKGSAVHMLEGMNVIQDCRFTGNQAGRGTVYGVSNEGVLYTVLLANLFEDNTATFGAAGVYSGSISQSQALFGYPVNTTRALVLHMVECLLYFTREDCVTDEDTARTTALTFGRMLDADINVLQLLDEINSQARLVDAHGWDSTTFTIDIDGVYTRNNVRRRDN
jgi:predicted outer membrane repeat protein